ncbi:MAG: hypothetical protein ACKVOO_12380 [Burkholderiaceae bacterium]
MALSDRINALATAIGNTLRDAVLPRLLPAGGSAGQVLAKTSAADYAAAWAAPAGGGAATLTRATLAVPYGSRHFAQVVLSDANATPASKVLAMLAGAGDSAETEAEDLQGWGLTANAGAGFINFNLSCPGPFGGPVDVIYQLG